VPSSWNHGPSITAIQIQVPTTPEGPPDEPDSTRSATGRRSGLVGGAAASFVSLAGSAFLTSVLTLVAIHVFDQAEYGRYALIVSVIGVTALVTDAGVSAATARLFAQRAADARGKADIFSAAVAVKLSTTVGVSLLFVLGGPVLADAFGDHRLAQGFRLAGIAAAGQAMLYFCRLVLTSDGSPLIAAKVVIVEALLELAVCTTLVVATGTAAAAIAGRAGAYAIGVAIGLVVLLRRLPAMRRATRPALRELLQLAPTSAVVDTAWVLFLQTPVLLIGLLLSSTEVAIFEAPQRFLLVATYAGAALALALGPRLATTPGAESAAQLRRAIRVVSLIQGTLLVVWTGLVAPNASFLFGAEYARSSSVFFGMSGYLFLMGISALLSYVVLFIGDVRGRAAAGLVSLAVNAVICVALLPPIGLSGAVVGITAGVTVHVLWNSWLAAQALDVRFIPIVRDFAVPGVLSGAFAAAGTGMAVVTSAPSELTGIAAAGCFLGVLPVCGAWDAKDTRSLIELVRRLVGRG